MKIQVIRLGSRWRGSGDDDLFCHASLSLLPVLISTSHCTAPGFFCLSSPPCIVPSLYSLPAHCIYLMPATIYIYIHIYTYMYASLLPLPFVHMPLSPSLPIPPSSSSPACDRELCLPARQFFPSSPSMPFIPPVLFFYAILPWCCVAGVWRAGGSTCLWLPASHHKTPACMHPWPNSHPHCYAAASFAWEDVLGMLLLGQEPQTGQKRTRARMTGLTGQTDKKTDGDGYALGDMVRLCALLHLTIQRHCVRTYIGALLTIFAFGAACAYRHYLRRTTAPSSARCAGVCVTALHFGFFFTAAKTFCAQHARCTRASRRACLTLNALLGWYDASALRQRPTAFACASLCAHALRTRRAQRARAAPHARIFSSTCLPGDIALRTREHATIHHRLDWICAGNMLSAATHARTRWRARRLLTRFAMGAYRMRHVAPHWEGAYLRAPFNVAVMQLCCACGLSLPLFFPSHSVA